MYTVYVHICPNGKRYYGATKQKVSRRWRNGEGYKGQLFKKAIQEYGWDNIERVIVAKDLTQEEAYWLEEELTRAWNKSNPNESYNINYGLKHSEETKKKMSKANSGVNHPFYGKRHTEESRKKIGDTKIGKDNPSAKSVICLTTKRIFYTAKEGGEFYKIERNNISSCCKGKRKSAGKYQGQKLVWRYLVWNHNKTYRIGGR